LHSSAEFELAVQCCRNSFGVFEGASSVAFPAVTDWGRFLRLVRFHRIEGLAWDSLSAHDILPAEVRSSLSEAAASIAAQNLQAAVECRTLLEAFGAANVPLLFLKGLTLGALAYRNPALKAAVDIDLLIDPADLGKAAALLGECGYRLALPNGASGGERLKVWHRVSKESAWTKDSPPLQIDLHTRAADNSQVIPAISVHSSRRLVDIGSGIRLPTFADKELFAYLAVHGASSAWFRLKWISDFAALLNGRDAGELASLHARSQSLGAGRAAGQALLLAHALFGTLDQAGELRSTLHKDRQTRRLFRAALNLIRGEPAEPTERRLGTLTIHWTQLLLLPGAGFALSELSRQSTTVLKRWRF
jgi:hypothetical protein